MATVVSMVNMKGGVGKTTIAFNLAWHSAWEGGLRVLAVDLDPQSNLSQYFMGDERYLEYIEGAKGTVVDIFEQFAPPGGPRRSPKPVEPEHVIENVHTWDDESLIDLIPSRLELSLTLKNPTEKAHLLPGFLARIQEEYDLVIIDCPPTESILTTAAYLSSRYVVVPVKPEFLATVGLPLLARSLEEFRLGHEHHEIEIAGILFNDCRRQYSPENTRSRAEVKQVAADNGWRVFECEAGHSDSYPRGARAGKPVFQTEYARSYVKDEFGEVGAEFLQTLGIG